MSTPPDRRRLLVLTVLFLLGGWANAQTKSATSSETPPTKAPAKPTRAHVSQAQSLAVFSAARSERAMAGLRVQ